MIRNNLAIIGLGYVGLPLAIEFSKKYNVIGFDINNIRVSELKNGFDRTKEVDPQILLNNNYNENFRLKFSSDLNDLRNCEVFIITVPTPIDQFKYLRVYGLPWLY